MIWLYVYLVGAKTIARDGLQSSEDRPRTRPDPKDEAFYQENAK